MKSTNNTLFMTPFWVALAITLFLFYIDEGYYDLRWMKDPGNWVVFLIYVAILYSALLAATLLGHFVATKLIKRNRPQS